MQTERNDASRFPNPRWMEMKRVSTEAQDIRRQRSEMKALRERYHATTVREIELLGVSGTVTMNNREMQQTIAWLASPDNDGIATSAIDRVMRPKGFACLQLFEAFLTYKKCIWSLADGFIDPTTNEGYMKLYDALGRASAEYRRHCERVNSGILEKRKRLELPYQRPPYGYRNVRKRLKIDGCVYFAYDLILHPDDKEKQDLVRRIFRMSSREGLSDHAIARILNREGKPGPRGGAWHRQTITNILDNTAYIGWVRQGRPCRNRRRIVSDTEANIPCPRLLEDDRDFKIAQARSRRNYEKYCGRKSEIHQLQHLVWCAKPGCGHRMCGKKVGRGYRKYWCEPRGAAGCKLICGAPAIKGERLENAIWGDAISNLSDARRVAQMLREFHRQAPSSTLVDAEARKLARLKGEQAAAEKNLDDPNQEYRRAELSQKLAETRKEIAALEAQLETASAVMEMPSRATLEALAAVVQKAAQWTTYQQRRPLLTELIERVDYFDGGYEMTLKIPSNESGINALSCGRNGQEQQAVLANFTPLKISGRIAA